MITLIDNVVTNIYKEIAKELKIDDKSENIVKVRISNLIKQSKIRDLGPDNIIDEHIECKNYHVKESFELIHNFPL